jgi:hypothetical protein
MTDDKLAAFLAALKTKAEKATPEPWRTYGVGDEYDTTAYLQIGKWRRDCEGLREDGMAYDDHEFIAAFCPKVALALVRVAELASVLPLGANEVFDALVELPEYGAILDALADLRRLAEERAA